jgi:hypothetical protein
MARATLDNHHFLELKAYSTITDNSLFLKYKEITADHKPVYERGHIPPGARLHIACLIPDLFSTLKRRSQSAPGRKSNSALSSKRKTKKELDGYVKTTLTEKATADTAMRLDQEPTIEPAIIKSMIPKGVTDAKKDLKKTIERLQQSIDRSSDLKTSLGPNTPHQQRKKTPSQPEETNQKAHRQSRHIQQQHLKRQRKKEEDIQASKVDAEEQSILHKFRVQEEEIARSTSRYFGFCADITKSPPLHNTALVLAE